MKGRQSGMPTEEVWSSFFDFECILSKLGCDERCGDVVEFGCGYGHFTEAAAEKITGTVYAVDIENEIIEATRSRLAKSGLLNVEVEQGDFLAHGCGRPDASVDFAMLFNILHIEEPAELLQEARRVLVPGGGHWNLSKTLTCASLRRIRKHVSDIHV